MADAKFQIERKCEIYGKSFIVKTLTYGYSSKNCSQTVWSKGGATDIYNCQMLCKSHNRVKGNIGLIIVVNL